MTGLLQIPLWVTSSLLIFSLQYTIVAWNAACIVTAIVAIRLLRAARYALRWVTWPIPSRFFAKQRLFSAMMRIRRAGTYPEWLAAARELDNIDGSTQWRQSSSRSDSDEFDTALLEETSRRLRAARHAGD